jgi:hypothetical protein
MSLRFALRFALCGASHAAAKVKPMNLPARWLIFERYISSDGGLTDRFDVTCEPRVNPLTE